MIIVGSASDEFGERYARDYRTRGIVALKDFPILNSILGEFSNFKAENHDGNVFLNLAAHANDEPVPPWITQNTRKELEAVEATLTHAGVLSFGRKKKNDLISKMRAFGLDSYAVYYELDFLRQLFQLPAVNKVAYQVIEGSTHDFRFHIEDEEYNVELTTIGEGEPAKILREAFDDAAKTIYPRVPDDTILRLDVKTDLLLNSKGRLDHNEIVKSLVKKTEQLWPIIITDRGNLHVWCIGTSDKTLYEQKDLFEHYGDFGERLQKLLGSPAGIEFLRSTRAGEFAQCPIYGVMNIPGRGKLVEIHSQFIYPSTAQALQEKSLLRQLENAVKEKLLKNQLKGQKNSLIAVKFDDIQFRGYSDDSDYFGKERFKLAIERVLKAFDSHPQTDVLGVLLYERNISHAKFVQNPHHAIPDAVLSQLMKTFVQPAKQCDSGIEY